MLEKLYKGLANLYMPKVPEPGASVFDGQPHGAPSSSTSFSPAQPRPPGQSAYQNFSGSRFSGRLQANHQMHAQPSVQDRIQTLIDNDHDGKLNLILANPAFNALPPALQLTQLETQNGSNDAVNAHLARAQKSQQQGSSPLRRNAAGAQGQTRVPGRMANGEPSMVQANPAYHHSPEVLQKVHREVEEGTNEHVNAYLQQAKRSRQPAAAAAARAAQTVAEPARSAEPAEDTKIQLSPLMDAAKSGDVEAIDELLKSGESLHVMDGFGRTALSWGASSGSEAAVGRLLGAIHASEAHDGPGVLAEHLWQRDVDNNTPLTIAAVNGNMGALIAFSSFIDQLEPAEARNQFLEAQDACTKALSTVAVNSPAHASLSNCLAMLEAELSYRLD
ncbi:MAG: ankyrin repeat domain-containing protein [Janthinobacterium lividum]